MFQRKCCALDGIEVHAGWLDETLLQIEGYRTVELEVRDSDAIQFSAIVRC